MGYLAILQRFTKSKKQKGEERSSYSHETNLSTEQREKDREKEKEKGEKLTYNAMQFVILKRKFLHQQK